MKKTILVVDDEPDLLEIVHSHLQESGHEVLTAPSGRAALEMVKKIKPSLIILDIAMPGMDGFEMLEILRGTRELGTIPVIMLTAQGQSKNIFEAERLRAVDFVTKPFTRQQLLEAVQRVL
jgi:CheY-like chemotaxis protein